ncbi:hypothetical protein E2C01_096872 [Portunus trituberculatus]|uniref:Uncharacterized protein n=1 Tax=Portunus trituberculatus TaxID=210409 RepID=A0A5B7K2X0_PORTR|nr:hypothetical protein [Portunus trituberculatus]
MSEKGVSFTISLVTGWEAEPFSHPDGESSGEKCEKGRTWQLEWDRSGVGGRDMGTEENETDIPQLSSCLR